MRMGGGQYAPEWEVGRTREADERRARRGIRLPAAVINAEVHRSDSLSRDTATLILLHFVIHFFPTTTVANSISLEPMDLDSKSSCCCLV